MKLRSLYLHHFRCHKEKSFEFNDDINTICGPNAQGKTSILEAIHLLIAGRSFRTSSLTDMIHLGTSHFYVQASFIKHGIEQQLKFSYNGQDRVIFHNDTSFASTSSLFGLLQGVTITPDDIGLIKGSPVVRRQFLDMQIAQTDPLYYHHLCRYNRAMRQRNALLRGKSRVALDSWEHEMANSAAYLASQRNKAVSYLQVGSNAIHHTITAEAEDLELSYKSEAPLRSDVAVLRQYYMEQFYKMRDREMVLGYTLKGPHKDDLLISIGGKEVKLFASEGQQRSCVAAMRFAEWERLKQLSHVPPLMLIDDVGVSLDHNRLERLLQHTKQLGQVFLTTTKEPEVRSQKPE